MQEEIDQSGASIHSSPASLPRKQQMTQKKEMKTQDIKIPQALGCGVDCLTTLCISEGPDIPLCISLYEETL